MSSHEEESGSDSSGGPIKLIPVRDKRSGRIVVEAVTEEDSIDGTDSGSDEGIGNKTYNALKYSKRSPPPFPMSSSSSYSRSRVPNLNLMPPPSPSISASSWPQHFFPADMPLTTQSHHLDHQQRHNMHHQQQQQHYNNHHHHDSSTGHRRSYSPAFDHRYVDYRDEPQSPTSSSSSVPTSLSLDVSSLSDEFPPPPDELLEGTVIAITGIMQRTSLEPIVTSITSSPPARSALSRRTSSCSSTPSKSKKRVSFSDHIELVGHVADVEEEYLPNPILERVLRQSSAGKNMLAQIRSCYQPPMNDQK